MSSSGKYHTFLDAKILEDQAAKAKRELKVFLAGPYINVLEPNTSADNTSCAASIARFALYHSLDGQGTLVLLGEHERLKDAADASFAGLNNATLYERKIILDRDVDAVIIFPSSPGSFLEFGDWANDEIIGSKLLVLIDAQYEEHKNYLNLGPVLLAKTVGAQVNYIAYDDHTAIGETVSVFLEQIVAKQNVARLYGRR